MRSIVMAVVLCAGLASLASAQDAKAKGEKVFADQKCSLCHAVAGKGNAKGHDKAKKDTPELVVAATPSPAVPAPAPAPAPAPEVQPQPQAPAPDQNSGNGNGNGNGDHGKGNGNDNGKDHAKGH